MHTHTLKHVFSCACAHIHTHTHTPNQHKTHPQTKSTTKKTQQKSSHRSRTVSDSPRCHQDTCRSGRRTCGSHWPACSPWSGCGNHHTGCPALSRLPHALLHIGDAQRNGLSLCLGSTPLNNNSKNI